MTLEQGPDQPLFVRPRVGINHIKVSRDKAEFIQPAVHVSAEPAKPIAAIETGLAFPGDEAAADKLYGQVEVGGEPHGGVYQFSLDLDAAGIEVEHGGQTSHHPEAAAPFAEQVARREVGRRQGP